MQNFKCPKCKVEFVYIENDCPVCYYRTMAAKYGAMMSHLRTALQIIDESKNAEEIKGIAHTALKQSPDFNFIEIYSDCLLVLIECGAFMEKAIKLDLPDDIVPDLLKINEMMAAMIEKYKNGRGE